jgi:hypothetical protein
MWQGISQEIVRGCTVHSQFGTFSTKLFRTDGTSYSGFHLNEETTSLNSIKEILR